MMFLAASNWHAFAWSPMLGADSWGMTVRRRRKPHDWVHYRIVFFLRHKRAGDWMNRRLKGQRIFVRKTLTVCEVSRWTTRNGTQDRDDLKAYVRLKIGPGGRAEYA